MSMILKNRTHSISACAGTTALSVDTPVQSRNSVISTINGVMRTAWRWFAWASVLTMVTTAAIMTHGKAVAKP